MSKEKASIGIINLHNVGNDLQVIRRGDKIAQIVMMPIVPFRAYCRHDTALYDYPITMSDRGDGALGSTDEPESLKHVFDPDNENDNSI